MNDMNDQTLSSYNKRVDKYIETSPQIVDGHIKAWIDKNLASIDKGTKILEIGSGSGKDSDYFESKGYEMELTDGSQGFVDYLNSKNKKARLLNALTDDFGSNYGVVFADAVFLHFNPDELALVLKKAYQALNPKGKLVFSLKAGEGEEITERKLDATRYFCFWEEKDIRTLLEKSGFINIEVDTTGDYRGGSRPDWLLISSIRG